MSQFVLENGSATSNAHICITEPFYKLNNFKQLYREIVSVKTLLRIEKSLGGINVFPSLFQTKPYLFWFASDTNKKFPVL